MAKKRGGDQLFILFYMFTFSRFMHTNHRDYFREVDMKNLFIISFVLLTVSACSNKYVYDALQTSRMDCLKSEMSQRERDACNQKVDSQKSYDEYSKEQQRL